jgi:hypothetical protein
MCLQVGCAVIPEDGMWVSGLDQDTTPLKRMDDVEDDDGEMDKGVESKDQNCILVEDRMNKFKISFRQSGIVPARTIICSRDVILRHVPPISEDSQDIAQDMIYTTDWKCSLVTLYRNGEDWEMKPRSLSRAQWGLP